MPLAYALPPLLAAPLCVGWTYQLRYPFVHSVYTKDTEEGPVIHRCWRPGCMKQTSTAQGPWLADGEGLVLYTVVSLVTPPGWRERVFYTRQWHDPDGRAFGKHILRVRTTAEFRKLLRGYRYAYDILPAIFPA
jgi:hypothetical protein